MNGTPGKRRRAVVTAANARAIPRRRQADRGFSVWWAVHHAIQAVSATLWNFIDNRAVIRRVAFVWVLWMTSIVIYWAMDFADDHPDMDGLKMAAILGAVLTPWSAMQAAIFKFYSDSVDPAAVSLAPGSSVTTTDTSTQTTKKVTK